MTEQTTQKKQDERISNPEYVRKFAHDMPNNPAAAYLLSLRSDTSRGVMATYLNKVARLLGEFSLATFSWSAFGHLQVQTAVDKLQKEGLAPSTINTYLAAMKGVARNAWLMKQIDAEAFQHVQQIRSLRGRRRPVGRALRKTEVKEIFSTCDRGDDMSIIDVRDAAIVGILLGCGLRRAEIIALDYPRDVDWDEASLRVQGKGDRERLAFMPEWTAARLKSWIYLRDQFAGPIFTRMRRNNVLTGNRLSPQAIYFLLKTRRTPTGVDLYSPHDLRRTFATALFNNGEDIRVVQLALGHESIETTKRYDMSGEQRTRAAASKLQWD